MRTGLRSLVAGLAAAALLASGCQIGGGEEPRAYQAEFSRAVQVFPGVKVKVLGVDVGRVTSVENVEGSVQVNFKIEDPDIKVPADVNATIVPISLLGERYVQLFPAYTSGPTLENGSTIPLAKTTVPAEGDELLQGMQDYLGALDEDTVEEFVTNTADVLEGKGARLNELIANGSSVLNTLSEKREEITNLIVQFNTLTQSLATRQDALGQLINTYNVVGTTVNEVRGSLQGTITGLNDAASQLASLLIDHEGRLGTELETLTQTTRTLSRNVNSFARTGKWARKLFTAAGRAADYGRGWLRLGNQGKPLTELILARLQDRLVGLCLRLEAGPCQKQAYWEKQMPELFCVGALECKKPPKDNENVKPERTVEEAIKDLPDEINNALDNVLKKNCKLAKHPKKCRLKKKKIRDAAETGTGIDDVIDDIIDGLGEFEGDGGLGL